LPLANSFVNNNKTEYPQVNTLKLTGSF